MEKKGEFLNQLAIIADLLEKVNINFMSSTIVFDVSKDEFQNVYNYISRKQGEKFIELRDDIKSFTVNIGETRVIINKSNV